MIFYAKVQNGQGGGRHGYPGHRGGGEGGQVCRGRDRDADQEVERVAEKKPPHLPTQHWPLKVQKVMMHIVNQSPKLQIPARSKTQLKHHHSH